MKSFTIILIAAGMLFLFDCNPKKSNAEHSSGTAGTAQLIVYGSPDCPHCQNFIHSLDSAGILYDFRAVSEDSTLFHEMMQKIRKANIKGYISYPVVDVNGHILVHPPIKDLMPYLQQ